MIDIISGQDVFNLTANEMEDIFQDDFSITPGEFKPSPYQQAIFDFVANETGNGIVYGVAGCGKTTTNIQALDYVPDNVDVVFLAFNRHIANELKERGVSCASTFHSLGRKAIMNSKPKARFDQYKIFNLIDKHFKDTSYDDKAVVAKIIGLLKGNLLDAIDRHIYDIMDSSSSINVDYDDQEYIAKMVRTIFDVSSNDENSYDFDDMIYWPAVGKVSCEKFDFIFVDECQDLNKAQIVFAEKSLRENGRMLLIGDPHQSIYAFRGAFVGIMQYMKHKIQATELPLTISYRAPLAVVDFVNQNFPEIKFEAGPAAKQGSVNHISQDEFLEQVNIGDGIICRTNAPLVEPCFALIRRGIKATILGRDIGKGLVSLVNKRAKLSSVYHADNPLSELINQLYVYFGNEKTKLEKAGKDSRIAALEDQIETIVAISDDCNSIKELTDKIKKTFSDDNEGIVFSSIHKAKGLEWNKVYILRPELLPHPMAKSDTDKQQERNIHYVAVTRAKQELYFVR